MKAGRAQRLPFQGCIQRVVGKYCLFLIVALIQANTFPIFNIYGWYYFDISASHMRKLKGKGQTSKI
jgi:hypothetical protein